MTNKEIIDVAEKMMYVWDGENTDVKIIVKDNIIYIEDNVEDKKYSMEPSCFLEEWRDTIISDYENYELHYLSEEEYTKIKMKGEKKTRETNLLKLYNKYLRFYGLDGEIFEMEDFNQILGGLEPLEIIKQVDVDFDVHAPYVYHNGLQWESLDVWDVKMVVEQQLYSDFIKWMVDNDEILIYTVDELPMEEKMYDDMNSNVYDLVDNYARVGYDALERMINQYELLECDGYYYLEYVG